jgi:flagellum-specific peptidoglycan hydrolase FlgJ
MSIDRLRLVRDWLEAAKPTAGKIGCSPSAIVAQAVLETGWGQSAIGNNVFGIKADSSWHGKRRKVRTREVLNDESVMVDDWFRDYDSVAESFADHFAFLERNGRYRAAGVFDPDNTKTDRQYFEALQRAGYATDPNYANALTAVQATVERMAAVTPAPRQVLMQGDTGDDVAAVQRALIAFGFDCGDRGADGRFGGATMAAVRGFQRSRGLTVDGWVGPTTRAALGL